MIDLAPRIRDVVALHLEVDPARLVPEASLTQDLAVDSLTAVDLAMVLEDEFNISLPEEVVADVRTYQDILTVVSEQISRSARPPAGDGPS